jgi:predicted AlkP superfamily pyrophosphatase or phosphodiesterase
MRLGFLRLVANNLKLTVGLYPESHGIVGNTFWDPDLQEEFYYTNPSISLQPKWWGGEPLWVTAENAGVRTAIHMWPGSEAHIGGVEPAFIDKYDGSELLSRKVDRILGLLDLPGPDDRSNSMGDERPQFIAAYVPVVDADGHKYGPNSTEIRSTISDVDYMLHDIFAGLRARNLTDVVNVVVVSDHGMATTSNDRLIQLEDLVGMEQIEHTDGWPLYGLRLKDPDLLPVLYEQLKKPSPMREFFDVYLRDQNMPERYHFSKNSRIAPLWIIPKTGWAIVTKKEFDIEEAKATGRQYEPRGLHGYDHEHPLMRSIFVARGPAFPHKPNSRVDVFRKLEPRPLVVKFPGVSANDLPLDRKH